MDLKIHEEGIKITARFTLVAGMKPNGKYQLVGFRRANTYVKGIIPFFNGRIDEVGLFNRALSASEIKAIYRDQK